MRGTIQTVSILILVFIIQLTGVITNNLFTLTYPLLSNPVSLIVNVYSHIGLTHLTSNLIGLIIFGLIVETVTDWKRFHLFFITTGVISASTQVIYNSLIIGSNVGVIGASGAIFGLIGYVFTGNKITVSFMDSIGLIGKTTLIIISSVIITLSTGGANVALVAHATGFIIGCITGYYQILHTEQYN